MNECKCIINFLENQNFKGKGSEGRQLGVKNKRKRKFVMDIQRRKLKGEFGEKGKGRGRDFFY